MLLKIGLVLLLFVICFNLGRGMYCLVQDRGQSDRTLRSLTWRISLSLGLFIFLFVAFAMGWIHPHPL